MVKRTFKVCSLMLTSLGIWKIKWLGHEIDIASTYLKTSFMIIKNKGACLKSGMGKASDENRKKKNSKGSKIWFSDWILAIIK